MITRPWALMGLALFVGVLAGAVSNVLPGLVLLSWTPVWATYALWRYLLHRQQSKLPTQEQLDQELKDLLEKEGKK